MTEPSKLIDERVEELGDWRGVPTRCYDGMLCTGESYKDKGKLTFAKGAEIDAESFKELIRAAVALNTA
ncbi:MAG TPA: hypothetical protein VHR18_10065 [Solirubrobacterales bacterium]|jgi:hypothetical protein|nr:hypothetical protein [Solirubrobacterales bacterium]